MDEDATNYEVGLGPDDIVLDGDPAHAPSKVQSPQFSAHICCGQTAGWIKMALGMGVGLGPDHIVLDGEPCSAPTPKVAGAPSPIYGPCLLWPNGWMDQDGTWHGDGSWSRPHCGRWGPSSPLQTGAEPPTFRPIFSVTKRLDASRCHLVRR